MRCFALISFYLFAFLGLTAVGQAKELCDCPQVFEPSCGSDGRSYSSPCLLECSSQMNGGTITMVYEGRCEDVTPILIN